jgi:hypothetical protein
MGLVLTILLASNILSYNLKLYYSHHNDLSGYLYPDKSQGNSPNPGPSNPKVDPIYNTKYKLGDVRNALAKLISRWGDDGDNYKFNAPTIINSVKNPFFKYTWRS